MNNSSLTIQAGFASLQGRRADNQDYVGWVEPADAQALTLRGVVVALADGVGGAKGGRQAAETAVRLFLDGYYSLPETLGPERMAMRALSAANRWIHSLGRRDNELAHMASTFSALILRGRHAHVLHLGDSRVYRLRGDSLERLTEDHTLGGADLSHVLYRAVGLEEELRLDYAAHVLEPHDRFLLCSDGVHGVLRESELQQLLRERGAPQHSAERLAQLALDQGSHDNITALVLDVLCLPLPDRAELRHALNTLPIREPPAAGRNIDGFRLERLLSDGRYSRLFVAHDSGSDATVVLKFPQPRVVSEREYHDAFLREAWIGARIQSPWLAEIIELPPGRQTCLYSVLPFYLGNTLEQRIAGGWKIDTAQGVDLALKLCRALHALHRRRVIHRDVKPDNVLLLEDGGVRLLDLGVARLPAWDEAADAPIPGTASYLAPEQFHGERGNERTDVYALGVTLFRLFSGGAYPYGEIEPFSTPRFTSAKRLTDYRHDLPAWLGGVLAKATAADPQERYADTLELAFDLEHGLNKGCPLKPARKSWYQRNPLRFWQTTALLLLILLLLSLARLHMLSSAPT
ncbi:MAG: bifunctional protein-serine/threonine kinase/phosphatase [Methylococcaceae bacterium]|nr:MAG: bifunctional protein-serine/threonine kinase/phosphatase [Methylococcaceae bacterium]